MLIEFHGQVVFGGVVREEILGDKKFRQILIKLVVIFRVGAAIGKVFVFCFGVQHAQDADAVFCLGDHAIQNFFGVIQIGKVRENSRRKNGVVFNFRRQIDRLTRKTLDKIFCADNLLGDVQQVFRVIGAADLKAVTFEKVKIGTVAAADFKSPPTALLKPRLDLM